MQKGSKINRLTESFWTERYKADETGWNIGYASTPIVEYFAQVIDKNAKILIPGAGNSYEAEHLLKEGFKQVYVLDISKEPLKNLKERCPDFPSGHLLNADFFEHHLMEDASYDYIVEQTFFCALDPALRQAYAHQVLKLLKPKGSLVGLWFGFPLVEDQVNPPFGGTLEEYTSYFDGFEIRTFANCHNSIPPRMGKEYFGILKKQIDEST